MMINNIENSFGNVFNQEHQHQQTMMFSSPFNKAANLQQQRHYQQQNDQVLTCDQDILLLQQSNHQQDLKSLVHQGLSLPFPITTVTEPITSSVGTYLFPSMNQHQEQVQLTAESKTAALGNTLEEIISMFGTDAFEPTPIQYDNDSSLNVTPGALASPMDESSSSSSTISSKDEDTTSFFFQSSEHFQLQPQQHHLEGLTVPSLDHFRHEAPSSSTDNFICQGNRNRIVVKDILMPANKKKRNLLQRNNKTSTSSATKVEKYSPKFRVYQKEKWWERYEELVEFFQKNGHSQVAHTEVLSAKDKGLARWVKRQKYQYRISLEGQPSSMTKERIAALEKVNFVWDSHGAAWEDRIKELEAFKTKNKHCNVPSNCTENPSLASWVKCQRRNYRLFKAGEPTTITMERIVQLEKMGFQWSLRMSQKL